MNATLVGVSRYVAVGMLGFGAGWGGREALAQKRQAQWQAKQDAYQAQLADDRVCTLALPGITDDVPVFRFGSNAEELVRLKKRGAPQDAITALLKDSDGFLVPSGTPCSVVHADRRSEVSEVRFLYGEHAGKTGHVPTVWRNPGAIR